MRKVLLDTNMIVAVFDQEGTTSDEMKASAKAELTGLLNDNEVVLVITSLIRYEVLRGIAWAEPEKLRAMKQVLNGFLELDIERKVSELASDLFRLDYNQAENSSERNINKRNFDIFHFAVSKHHGLDLVSNDRHIPQLETLYQQFQSA
ncbi:PIN domain-containing protein [Thiomicrospira microaerophila]|uniref:type II toxin-antitoxin system VapC family toxin n=1 Tax=Thiomicrospira microaerophila TaxID=406020 RepID=UPI00200DDA2C|nr:PIN domain-containing protein [Thiomicrospira microaerophila]UQB42260.1 PIN domain-containing protein [Thiomicrospira microaerophila]